MTQEERDKRDRQNFLRREARKKAKAALGLKCKHCDSDIPVGRRSLDFCSDKCKVDYFIKKTTAKYQIEGYPKLTQETRDKKNAGRRERRRKLYVAQEYKCKQCGITLTEEHYPKLEFCSRDCGVKYHSKTANKIKTKEIKEEIQKEKSREKMIHISIDSRTIIEIPESQRDNIEVIKARYIAALDIKNRIKGPVSWAVITQ